MNIQSFNRLTALAILLVDPVNSAFAVPTFNIQTIQSPTDPAFTQLLGINNAGTIAGFHGAANNQAFTLTLPNAYTNQNFPGSTQSQATAINNAGSIAGIYVDADGTTHGYTHINGTFTTVDQPGTQFNQALGINDNSTTVGYSSTDPHGATGQKAYSQSGGVFTDINALIPNNFNSQAVGINNAGFIVGFYQPTMDTSIGFVDVRGEIRNLDPFHSTFTQALGINNNNEIVGIYYDANGFQHGFININGVNTTIDPVGSLSTTINGINDQGQIVGFYTDNNDNLVGFVGTPTKVPEPATFALLMAGFMGVKIQQRRGV